MLTDTDREKVKRLVAGTLRVPGASLVAWDQGSDSVLVSLRNANDQPAGTSETFASPPGGWRDAEQLADEIEESGMLPSGLSISVHYQ